MGCGLFLSSVFGRSLANSHFGVGYINSFRDMFLFLIARDFNSVPSLLVPGSGFRFLDENLSFWWWLLGFIFFTVLVSVILVGVGFSF